QGNGNYIPDFNGANGKVYKWVEPVNGQKQGRFEAAIFLVTPKKQQVVSLGMDYAFSKNSLLTTEVAMSNYDLNTFSKLDKGNDKGSAAKFYFRNIHPLAGQKKLLTELGYEFVESTFRPIERLRNVEFTRDWGLPLVVQPVNEHIYTAGLGLADAKNNSIKYQLMGYIRGDDFTGLRNTINQNQQIKSWQFNNQLSLSNMSTKTDKGYFLRPVLNVSKTFTI